MYQVAICDNDKISLKYLNQLVDECMEEEHHIASFRQNEALEYYIEETMKGKVDIVFLDINLDRCSGIDVAKRIKKMFRHIRIIFVTGFLEYSGKIFEIRPTYFLAKPIKKSDMLKALLRAKAELEEECKHSITLVSKGLIARFPFTHVIYIESNARKLAVYLTDDRVEVYAKLTDIEKQMPDYFVRCHQSYIVNMEYVKYLNQNTFQMNNGTQIPISQSRLKTVKEQFLKMLGES